MLPGVVEADVETSPMTKKETYHARRSLFHHRAEYRNLLGGSKKPSPKNSSGKSRFKNLKLDLAELELKTSNEKLETVR